MGEDTKFKTGHTKVGGRKRGTPNKSTEKINALIEKDGCPVEFLLKLMNDDKQPLTIRVDCAKAVAPFTNRRKPTAVENTDMNPLKDLTVDDLLQKLTELEDE